MTTIDTRTTLTALATLVLAACGGGSGGSSDNSSSSEPSGADTAMVQAPTEDRSAREPADAPPPASAPTSAHTPTSAYDGPLRDLFGQVRIDHAFSGGNELLSVETVFDASSLLGDESALVAQATLGLRPIDTGELLSNPDALLSCAHAELLDEFVCVATTGTSMSSLLFVFERLEDGFALGSFEYCPDGMTTSICSRNIVLSSDGGAFLRVDPVIAAARSRPEAIETDPMPYIGYAAQGLDDHGPVLPDADSRDRISILSDAFDSLH